ncbi:MAG: lysine--tRNA ligase [Patescibacteria group bacterium]|nr:lysine--tRNA ligase [Patescibacteria group bacterium]
MNNNIGATEKELIEFRKKKLAEIEKLGLNPYPSKSNKDHTCKEILDKQKELIDSEKKITVAGRLMALRGHGKLVFADVSDESGKIQAVLKADSLGKDFDLVSLLDLGDFVEVRGTIFVTKAGEVSVLASNLTVLSKALRQLPEKRHGIQDEETRLRKRYLEFAINPEARELFIKKAKFWQATRDFLVKKGFLEVETPALENTAGGADANPFITHHDALDIDVFLRISMGELWQKRLMVGGFEKTFEIGRQFRNEGISREHLQDYSQMEFYWAYANYEDSMKLVEELYKYIAEKAFGTLRFKIGEFDVDLGGNWEKIDYVETIKSKQGIDAAKATDEEIKNKLIELKIKFNPADRRGRLIDALWKQIRKEIAGPVFLINHPVEVSPLAKRKEDNSKLVERYQVILAGSEMGNGYSELNDPVDQADRFKEQAKMREAGDKEAQMHDTDFVEALEYGMPPTTGFGFSERLFSFLADKSAREAQMFPLLRPEK